MTCKFQSVLFLTDSQSALSILSSAPSYHLPESLWYVWSLVSSLSNNITCWVSVEFLCAPIPRKGSGSTTTTVINRCQFISECESSSPKIVTRRVDFLTETSASFIPFQITLFLFVAIINWLPSFQ